MAKHAEEHDHISYHTPDFATQRFIGSLKPESNQHQLKWAPAHVWICLNDCLNVDAKGQMSFVLKTASP